MSASAGAQQNSFAPQGTVKLTDGWKVQSSAKIQATGELLSTPAASTDGWYDATVPSTLMAVLTHHPSPLTDYPSTLFNVSWWYRTTFTLNAQQKPLNNHPSPTTILSFDGLSYRANIWLNGHKIADANEVAGPFRQFAFDITPYVQEQNVLAVEVFRAQPGEPNIGFADWNPRPADESMGLFREVSLKTCGAVSVAHTAVRSKVDSKTLDAAWLTIDTELTNHTDREVQGTLQGTFDNKTYTAAVTLAPHEKRLVTLVADAYMAHPRLWWCHNMGKPELYDLHVEFRHGENVSDSEDLRFGIREIQSNLTSEGHRTFTLNGRPILLRGAGWTDDIYLRDTPATNRLQLEYVRDMNMNCVRLEGFWGNSQNLYDLCDELGLLILVGWSCHWEWEEYLGSPCTEPYGGITSPEQIAVIGKSFEDQVLWLRRHPSIIAWFVGSDRIPKPELEEQYRRFLSTYDDRCYLISAKGMTSTLSGPSGTKMEGPYEYVGPTYWYEPEAPGGGFGFNTETGIGAQLPVKESLSKMLGGPLFPIDERWNTLCTSSTSALNTPAKLTEAIEGRFGPMTDADQYLHRADLLSYESTRAMFEAFRVNVPHSTGIIQWMLNSARPGIYWQLYDYYKQPNAAYYAVKRANAPVQLIYDYQRRAVFAVNETLHPVTIQASLQLLTLQSPLTNHPSPITNHQLPITVQPGEPVKVFDLTDLITPQTSGAFLFLKASSSEGLLIAENEYFIPCEKDKYNWQESDWVGTPISRYASYRMLNELPTVNCETSCREIAPHRYQVTVSNPSEQVAFMLRLAARNTDGDLLCPAFWSDNHITLAPGETRSVTCDLTSTPLTPLQSPVTTHQSPDTTPTITLEGWNVKETSFSPISLTDAYEIVPRPQSIETVEGAPFQLNANVQILAPEALNNEASFLQTYMKDLLGLQLPLVSRKQPGKRYIELSVSPDVKEKEGYVLTVSDKTITINGGSAAGVFYGIQTLRKSFSPLLHPIAITDAPRFPYRGMHLDCSRHFFPVSFIKKYIDLLALHNMNVFHWHLTDDQGWRIEIKKWPRLTTIGSHRSGTIIGTNSDLDDHISYGGYYTQEEAREIVTYAKARHITVIPEIDMPGHMLAALASYPELGCTGGPYEVGHYWGVYQDVLCIGNPKVYQFVEDVLTEIMDIFPSEVIHIGGDEAPTTRWESCPKCQAVEKEAVKGEPSHPGYQSYFTQRVFNFLSRHGRRTFGWDEILEGCPQDAVIMSWRGTEPGAKAAALGHDVVMTPTSHCYFDYQQIEDAQFEPSRCGGFIPVERVYALEPVPTGISDDAARHILGAQANLWTEYVISEEVAEYQALPRMSALAEVQWSQPQRKDYASFLQRLTRLTTLFEHYHYTYAKHLWPERTLSNRWLF